MRNRNHHASPALRAAAKLGLAVAAFLALATPAAACPMCKDSAVGTAKSEDAPISFNKSIYIMLGGLGGVITCTGVVIYKATKSV